MIRHRRFIGEKRGLLTITNISKNIDKKGYTFELSCDCGKTTIVTDNNYYTKKSCGCANRPRPGYSYAYLRGELPEYGSWRAMMTRCYKANHKTYEHYGKRGITVTERWHDFANFKADMGDRPPGTSIDRIDVNGNYEPGNCRWATHKQQSLNKRVRLTHTNPN